ncbi:hypothetical protein FVA74_05200 [Salinibacterium sp. dk2585]|uniref:hypothetical protein n=1 Tax=unclassified Salinibacterium TaxID=2632331 RepID=UPI0011C24C2B|nr:MULTISPECIES: hypothetical protein [unclassified Salinibacterium]QEE61038.1 hypothetical protein FVA74_05200 [Salinibacterium sp. dk2585]TXK52980.1 hypothetical protein FVP63_11320 [Salinibacterium sp. dk5596]
MKRVLVIYDGMQYSVAAEDLDRLKSSIEEAVSSGRPRWVRVNEGEGAPRTAEVFVGPSTSIALIVEPSSGEEAL